MMMALKGVPFESHHLVLRFLRPRAQHGVLLRQAGHVDLHLLDVLLARLRKRGGVVV